MPMMKPVGAMMRMKPAHQIAERTVGVIARRQSERGADEKRQREYEPDRRIEHDALRLRPDSRILDAGREFANVRRRTAPDRNARRCDN